MSKKGICAGILTKATVFVFQFSLWFSFQIRYKNYLMYMKITDNFNSNQTNYSKSTQRNIFNFTYESFHTKLGKKITHVNDLSHKMYNLSLIFRDFYFDFFIKIF